jgi:head-tail adaptor
MIKHGDQNNLQAHFIERLDIQRKRNLGSSFRPIYDWDTLSTVNGLIDLLSSREIVMNEGQEVMADYLIMMNVTDITETDRIVNGDDIYNIYSIHNPNNRNHHLEIKAKLMQPGTVSEGT